MVIVVMIVFPGVVRGCRGCGCWVWRDPSLPPPPFTTPSSEDVGIGTCVVLICIPAFVVNVPPPLAPIDSFFPVDAPSTPFTTTTSVSPPFPGTGLDFGGVSSGSWV
ncbi:hypothetical protein DFH27DRAFT_548781 [Peziza echinospora]|nr:hypothetical protein DFH27DRAFT_548781 [Peziza echinospora]